MQLTTIQGGRGVAALAVVFFHLSVIMALPQYGGVPVFSAWTWRGNIGVDFFFVLSGFIMMFVHQGDIGRRERWSRYAYARFIRLYPIYWLYTIGFCVAALIGVGATTKLPTTFAGWFSSLALIRLTDDAAPLGVAWTLFHEIAFYAVFSVLILNRWVGVVLLALWSIVVAINFNYPPTDHPTPIQTYLAAYNLDFVIGICACAIMRSASLRTANAVFCIGISLLTATLVHEYRAGPLWWSGLPYGVAFGGIIAGMSAWEQRKGGVSIPLAKRLGDASYTVYLIHVPAIALTLKIYSFIGLTRALPGEAIFVLTLFGVILASLVAHRFIEMPMQKALRRKRSTIAVAQHQCSDSDGRSRRFKPVGNERL